MSQLRVECKACGVDCSNGYVTYKGDPYHAGCLPDPPRKKSMDIREFGDALIRTGDLDPVYNGLYRARLPHAQMERALLAYWFFYHLGFAAWASEAVHDHYWARMERAALNTDNPPVGDRWPRGTERRHFRGQKCVNAIYWLRKEAPEHWVRSLAPAQTEQDVINRVGEWPMFGPWIGFKAADMLERVYGQPLSFDPNLGLMYSSPRAALDLLAADKDFTAVDRTPTALYNGLLMYFKARRAPPSNDRQCNAQEVETVLCKWGSMQSGHYHVGKDITEVRHGLVGWGHTAQLILNAMPPEV